ncbi:serine palmitoyltransferase [Tremella mesenterica]|uniref:serine C-palmitoyltransferase n=1 Tax=Tremella mesenterica TaxID=5217 RepID=A0A4Q1BUK5_TREME|nr:serine palmitoyltransferase [Tremella mesenterica]
MSSTAPTEIPTPLIPLLSLLSSAFLTLQSLFHRIPGSPIIVRYIKSSYQDDPYRSLLEVLLLAFAVRTLLQRRTGGEAEGKSFIKLTAKEIDELVDDWQPVALVEEPNELDAMILPTVPTIYGPNGIKVKTSPTGKSLLNMVTPNWTGLVENERLKQVAVETLHSYGVGTCGPAGFYGYIDVHMDFEQELANFIGTESSITYAQGFAAVSSCIPAFAKRGDIIVADRGCNFAIQKGLQISRSTIRWFAHGDMADLEKVLQSVERDLKRKGGKLTKKFIVAEGIFENDGMLLDLPKVMELKKKFKYRLMLDETYSIGMVGAHGKGLTEYYGVPAAEVDMIFGSMASSFGTGGGFCAGSSVVCSHQRINSSASVFSASLPALLTTTSSTALSILLTTPTLFTTLQSNVLTFRAQLSKLEAVPSVPPTSSPRPSLPVLPSSASSTESIPIGAQTPNKDAIIQIPSHPSSALMYIFLLNPPSTVEEEEALLQDVVDEVQTNGSILITRARRLRGQETFEPEPSLKVCVSAAMGKKDVEKAGQALRAALVKFCSSE